MNSVAQVIERVEENCKAHGTRLTNKRKQVLSGLLQSNKALSAYELIEVCKAEYGEAMPAMSMYRILEFLRNEHLIHKLNLTNKYIACAHIACDHEHAASQFLICSKCQKVSEISVSDSNIEELKKTINEAGFELANPKLEISCICDSCFAGAG